MKKLPSHGGGTEKPLWNWTIRGSYRWDRVGIAHDGRTCLDGFLAADVPSGEASLGNCGRPPSERLVLTQPFLVRVW